MKSTIACLWLLLIGPISALSGAAFADTPRDASAWLMQINNAASQLNYTGHFVYARGDHIESMQVIHRGRGADFRQRIYSLNGTPREVIRDANQVWCYAPDKKLGVHENRQATRQGFPNLLPSEVDHLGEYYEIRVGRAGRIADRPARHIEIVPRDDLRYGYDLWADQDTGLLLKAALLDNRGRAIEQYLFTHVEIGGAISDQALQPVTADNELVWYGDAEGGGVPVDGGPQALPMSEWGVKDMPAGFMLTREIKRLSPIKARMLRHYVYSDGLASVSVFVEALDDDAQTRISGINKMGAVHAFGRVVEDHQVTVVGEVPSKTVDIIGMSVYSKSQ